MITTPLRAFLIFRLSPFLPQLWMRCKARRLGMISLATVLIRGVWPLLGLGCILLLFTPRRVLTEGILLTFHTQVIPTTRNALLVL